MARYVKVAAAQMGPNNEGTSREEIVERMLALLEQAVREDVELIAYPEMALTTYFPKRSATTTTSSSRPRCRPRRWSRCCERAARRPAWPATWASARRPRAATSIPRSSPTRRAGSRGRSGRSICPGVKQPDGHAQVYEPHFFETGDTRLPRLRRRQGARSASRSARTGATRSPTAASACRAPRSSSSATTRRSPPLALDLNELVPARGRLREQPLRGRHRQGRHRGRHGADRRLLHREPARPGARQGRHHRRRADRRAHRPRPDDARAQALGLLRPAPPAALRARHRARPARGP